MFHKALWLRGYKQGKIIIWLLFAMSFFLLPISYANSAGNIQRSIDLGWGTYFYSFRYERAIPILTGLSILLALILTGGERKNQVMDFFFSMPFKRSDIFLSKWFIGASTITCITLLNMILMYIVQLTTIHREHHTFMPFLNFFIFMFILLLTTYSVTLFIGTVTGGIMQQAILTFIIGVLPFGLFNLIMGMIEIHNVYYGLYNFPYDFFQDSSIFFMIFSGSFFQYFHESIIEPVQFTYWISISTTNYISLIIYLISSFILGFYAYSKSPIENNDKIILFEKLEPTFLWCTVTCFSLLGGAMLSIIFWYSLIFYYIGFVSFGCICYFVLSKLMKKPLKFKRLS